MGSVEIGGAGSPTTTLATERNTNETTASLKTRMTMKTKLRNKSSFASLKIQ